MGHYIAITSCYGEHILQTTIELDISISSRRGVTQETQFQVNTDLIPICRYGADVFSTSTYKVYVQGKELQVRR